MKWRGMGILAVVVLAALGIGAALGWYGKPADIRALPVWNEAQPVKTVTKIKTVKVPGPKEVITIEKEKIVEKLKLPDWVKDDVNQQAIATAEIPPYEGKTNAVALLNTQDGSSRIIAKQMPLPFFDVPNEWEIGGGYGIDTHGQQMAQIDARWTFLRLGDIRVAGYIEGNSRPEGKAMIKAYIRR